VAAEQTHADAGLREDTRLIFMGEAALTEGFRLIGFETWPDASERELDQVLGDLLKSRARAFLVLDDSLSQCCSVRLRQVRSEGGRIVVTEVPRLREPQEFRGAIDAQVRTLLGGQDLDRRG
jgi:vacuolar-type H+-ATPase subunit F/Vma7